MVGVVDGYFIATYAFLLAALVVQIRLLLTSKKLGSRVRTVSEERYLLFRPVFYLFFGKLPNLGEMMKFAKSPEQDETRDIKSLKNQLLHLHKITIPLWIIFIIMFIVGISVFTDWN